MCLSSAFGPCALGRPVAAGRVGLGPREDSGARSGRPHSRTAEQRPGHRRGAGGSPARPPRSPWRPGTQGAGPRRPPCSRTQARRHAGTQGRWSSRSGPLALRPSPGAGGRSQEPGARATGGLPVGSALGRPPAQPPGTLGRGAGGGLPVRGGVGQTAGRENFPVLGCRPPRRKRPAGAQAGESEGLCLASLASGPRDAGCQDPPCPTLARSVLCDGEAPWPLLPGYHRT